MSLALTIFLFLVGLVLIIKGGDWFVDAAAWMAEASGMPKFLIGATIVSVATTLPEIIVSTMAAAEGSTDMAIGNAIGSVTANIGLIMAVVWRTSYDPLHMRTNVCLYDRLPGEKTQ